MTRELDRIRTAATELHRALEAAQGALMDDPQLRTHPERALVSLSLSELARPQSETLNKVAKIERRIRGMKNEQEG